MMRIGIVWLAILNVPVFGLALRVVFAGSGRPPLPRLMVLIGSGFSCLHVFLLATVVLDPRQVPLGGGLYLSALGLFSWAAHSVRGREFRLAYAPGTPRECFPADRSAGCGIRSASLTLSPGVPARSRYRNGGCW